jgi:DNA-binding NtrC family response regulator
MKDRSMSFFDIVSRVRSSIPHKTSTVGQTQRSFALIADSEEAIRALVGRVVREFELQPLFAESEEQIASLTAQYRDHIACVLLGDVLPAMNIIGAANFVRQVAPELPQIAMSGLLPVPTTNQLPLKLFAFLPKPFSLKELRRVLQAVQKHLPNIVRQTD